VVMIPASYDYAATFTNIERLNTYFNFFEVTNYKRIDSILILRNGLDCYKSNIQFFYSLLMTSFDLCNSSLLHPSSFYEDL